MRIHADPDADPDPKPCNQHRQESQSHNYPPLQIFHKSCKPTKNCYCTNNQQIDIGILSLHLQKQKKVKSANNINHVFSVTFFLTGFVRILMSRYWFTSTKVPNLPSISFKIHLSTSTCSNFNFIYMRIWIRTQALLKMNPNRDTKNWRLILSTNTTNHKLHLRSRFQEKPQFPKGNIRINNLPNFCILSFLVPFRLCEFVRIWVRIFKLLRSPRIDS